MFRVEVSVRSGFPDPRGEALQKDIRDLGIAIADRVRGSDIYLPERFIHWTQHPRWTREALRKYRDGFGIFLNAVEWAKSG